MTQRPSSRATPRCGVRRRVLGAAGLIGVAWAVGAERVLAPRTAHAQSVVELDVPFVTTPDNVVLAMLEMGRVRAGDFLLDLGSGDGRIIITAALKYGVSGRGIEIDPALVAQSRDNARTAGVADKAEFIERDLFMTDLNDADVITMYLLPDVNIKLRPKLLALQPGVRIVSHDWTMGDWQPDQRQEIAAPQKRLGLRKVANLMAWTVPANVGGRHRLLPDNADPAPNTPPPDTPADLQIDQRYQDITGGLVRLGTNEYQLATQRIHDGNVTLQGQTRNGATLRLTTMMARQADLIEWQLESPNQPSRTLRTQRIPEPSRSADPTSSPG